MNTATMNVFLEMMSDELKDSEHAVLIMDQAGRHKSKSLHVPDNITVLYLLPELNPVERLWALLRSQYLSKRAFDGYDHLLAATAKVWQLLTPARLQSVCRCAYLPPEVGR